MPTVERVHEFERRPDGTQIERHIERVQFAAALPSPFAQVGDGYYPTWDTQARCWRDAVHGWPMKRDRWHGWIIDEAVRAAETPLEYEVCGG